MQKDEGIDAGIAYHLIIDEESTGSRMWAYMQQVMLKHLKMPYPQ